MERTCWYFSKRYCNFCFISFWTGRVSDKELTKCSDLLEKLEPGDNIMADRGFVIVGILSSGVTLNIPPFKGGKDQLNSEETDEKAIDAVRIHVEGAVGQVKNYHILDGNCPLSMTLLMNEVFDKFFTTTCTTT